METMNVTYTENQTTIVDGVNARAAIVAARALYGQADNADLKDPHVAPSTYLNRKQGTVKLTGNLIEYATKTDKYTPGNFVVAVIQHDVTSNGLVFEDVQAKLGAVSKLRLVASKVEPEKGTPYLQYSVIRSKDSRAKELTAWAAVQIEVSGLLVKQGKVAGYFIRHEEEIEAPATQVAKVSIREDKLDEAVASILKTFSTEFVEGLVKGLNSGLELTRLANKEEAAA